MNFAARIGDMHACPTHGGGTITTGGSPMVLIGGAHAARVTDAAECAGPPDLIIQGATLVLMDGLPAARLGDPTAHGGTITTGRQDVLIGGPTGPAGGVGTGRSFAGLPAVITIAPELCKQSKDLWNKSFPGGKSQEFCGTVTKDKDGTVRLVNKKGGSSGLSDPDRKVPAGQNPVGIFHTHPYDASEGGHTNVSLSGGDAGYMINNHDDFIQAQSGDGQFIYARTDKTPTSVDAQKVDDEQNARIKTLLGEGKSFDEASRIAARETAVKYGLAYYEGKNCVLNRVSP